MMLDAKRTFDELIERLAPDDEDARRGARQPDLPGALERGRRLAGVHGDRQALRPRPLRRVRRPRPRHAAVAQRARLPRRARPAHRLPRGPRAEGLPRPDRPRREGHGPRDERRVQRPAPRHRRRPAPGPQRVLPRARRPASTASASARAASRSCSPTPRRRSSSSPRPSASPVEEAIFFRGKLREAGMPFGGLIVNRVQLDLVEGDPDEAAAELDGELGDELDGEGRRDAARAAGARRARPRVARRG